MFYQVLGNAFREILHYFALSIGLTTITPTFPYVIKHLRPWDERERARARARERESESE